MRQFFKGNWKRAVSVLLVIVVAMAGVYVSDTTSEAAVSAELTVSAIAMNPNQNSSNKWYIEFQSGTNLQDAGVAQGSPVHGAKLEVNDGSTVEVYDVPCDGTNGCEIYTTATGMYMMFDYDLILPNPSSMTDGKLYTVTLKEGTVTNNAGDQITINYGGKGLVIGDGGKYIAMATSLTFTSVTGGHGETMWNLNATTKETLDLNTLRTWRLKYQLKEDGVVLGEFDYAKNTDQDWNTGILAVGSNPYLRFFDSQIEKVSPSNMEAGKQYMITIPAGLFQDNANQYYNVRRDADIFIHENWKATLVYPHESLSVATTQVNNNGFTFATPEDDGLSYSADWDVRPTVVSGGVWLNGEKLTFPWWTIAKIDSKVYTIPISDAVTGWVPSENDVITVEMLVYPDSSDTAAIDACKYVKFPKTSFQYLNGVWNIYEEVESDPTEGTFNINNVSGLGSNDSAYYMYVDIDSKIYGVADSIVYYYTVDVEGQDSIVGTFQKEKDNQFFLFFGKDAIQADMTEPLKMTIKAGESNLNSGVGKMTLLSDFTFYINPNGTVSTKPLNILTLNLASTGINDAAEIYFDGNSNIVSDITTDWNRKLTEPVEAEGGIFLNGNKITDHKGDTYLINYDDGKYYLRLYRWNVQANQSEVIASDGDKVTIKGLFTYTGSDDLTHSIYIQQFDMYWDELKQTWQTTPIEGAGQGTAQILGDATGDDMLNVKDVVRLKKYLDEKVGARINETNANANRVDGIDKKDLIKTYEYILNGSVQDGKYVSDAMPVYLDGAIEMALAAYEGPRDGISKYDFTTTGNDKDGYTLTSTLLDDIVDIKDSLAREGFDLYNAAGLNTVIHEADAPFLSDKVENNVTKDNNFIQYMTWAKERGMQVYVSSVMLNAFLKQGTNTNPTTWTADDLRGDMQELKAFLTENNLMPAFKGIKLSDELRIGDKDQFESAVSIIREVFGQDVNLFHSCLGKDAGESLIGSSYDNYVATYAEAIGELRFSMYPFERFRTGSKLTGYKGSEAIRGDMLSTFHDMAMRVKNSEKIKNMAVSLQSYGMVDEGFSTITFSDDGDGIRDPRSYQDISFQVYTALAHGADEINYFTFFEHHGQDVEWHTSSMVQYADNGKSQKTTEIYDWVKEVNKNIKKFDHVFANFDWVGSMYFGDNSIVSNVTSDNLTVMTGLEQTTTASGNVMISQLEDSYKGYKGFWIVNVEDPGTSNASVTADIHFKDADKAIVYAADGTRSVIDLDESGAYQCTIEIGKAMFVIPFQSK